MAKQELHERALEMRKLGMSYSQIKEDLKVSKGTLSIWLKDHPLSRERINELRGNSEKRIERCRETKARNREKRNATIYNEMMSRIGVLSGRELFLAGIFLYWAEGTKASRGVVQMTNTDPTMLQFFIRWLEAEGKNRDSIRVRLHFYSDMDITVETAYWSQALELPESSFRKPYIKESATDKHKNYKGRFGHGTCNIIVNDVQLFERIMNGIKYIGTDLGNGLLRKLAV